MAVSEHDLKLVKQWKSRIKHCGGFLVMPVLGTNFVDIIHDAMGFSVITRVLVKADFKKIVSGEQINPNLLNRLLA